MLTKKPFEMIVPEGTVLLVDMKLSYPRQKELTAIQACEVFFDVQSVSHGGSSDGADDGACLGALDSISKQPIFCPTTK